MNKLEVIFEDPDLVVVNKPAGMATHSSVAFNGLNVFDELVNTLSVDIKTSGDEYRQGVVSRLDVGTTGLLVVAKNEEAYSALKEMYATRTVDKTYLAIACGYVEPAKGTINAPLARDPKNRTRFAVVEGGREAITDYDVLEKLKAATLLKIKLRTGRTHQIRAHLRAFGHPLLGDLLYGGNPETTELAQIKRPALHSWQLGFNHPISGQRLDFEAPIPADFARAQEILKRGNDD